MVSDQMWQEAWGLRKKIKITTPRRPPEHHQCTKDVDGSVLSAQCGMQVSSSCSVLARSGRSSQSWSECAA
jgi:hypothetical protein